MYIYVLKNFEKLLYILFEKYFIIILELILSALYTWEL